MPSRVLCAGKELNHLQIRCAVLARAGYDGRPATLAEAEVILRAEQFDLMIVSAFLSDLESSPVLSAAGKTPVYVLQNFIYPNDLLAQVGRLLSANKRAASSA
jgi:hypothetical protein